MRGRWVFHILKFVLIAAVFIAAFGFAVMGLWNWLFPALFGWHRIAYVQALGILVLARILFGRFWGRPGGNRGWRGRMMERWAAMTPEEREKFGHGMRGYCGGFRSPQAEPKAPTA